MLGADSQSSDRLLQAIERAIERHNAKYRLKKSLDLARSLIATLTPREREVTRAGNWSERVYGSPVDALSSGSISDSAENGFVRYARHPDSSAAMRTAGLSFPVM
jgi:hypothetical protein